MRGPGIYDTEAGLNTIAAGVIAHARHHAEYYADPQGMRLVALSNAALAGTVGEAIHGQMESVRHRATDSLPLAGRALDQIADALAQSAGDILLLLGYIQKLEGDLQLWEAAQPSGHGGTPCPSRPT